MYLLDTVTISQSGKHDFDSGVRDFLASVPVSEVYVSSITIGELQYGVRRLAEGRRKRDVGLFVDSVEHQFEGRVLNIDAEVARLWGALRSDVQSAGRTVGYNDLLIAATALHHDLIVITRNVKDFEPTRCRVLNPWSDGA